MLRKKETWIKMVLFLCALIATITVISIITLITSRSFSFLRSYGVVNFIFGGEWAPLRSTPDLGILPMIVGTGAVTLCALLLATPIAIMCAIYMAEIASSTVNNLLKPLIDLLAGIPSVVYGFWGLIVLIPLLRRMGSRYGYSILAGGIVLAIMILPTITRISLDALKAVPISYKEGSYALGASRWQTTFKVVLPAASPGILTAMVLGMGRAIGETMAVLMVTGNVKEFPTSIMSPVRTLTGNIALEINYSWGTHREALFATGLVLVIIILLLNFGLSRFVMGRGKTFNETR